MLCVVDVSIYCVCLVQGAVRERTPRKGRVASSFTRGRGVGDFLRRCVGGNRSQEGVCGEGG